MIPIESPLTKEAPALLPTSRFQRHRIRYLKRSFLTSLLAVGSLAFYFAPAPHSKSNDLLFFFTHDDSPLRISHAVDLTTAVVPRRIHSHNDYEQPTPLYKAISYGAASVEADIWETDGPELLVGHTKYQLNPERTLSSLYTQPLLDLLDALKSRQTKGSIHGIFQTAPSITLNLLIDIKTNGSTTFEKLYQSLAPLRKAGYLTTLSSDMTTLQYSAVTVIGTGNTPLESVQSLGHTPDRPRDIFLDAPLTKIPKDDKGVYNYTTSPLASADFFTVAGPIWPVPILGTRRIKRLVQAAHQRGIQTRFWNTPSSPKWIRNSVWQILLSHGSDWLNVDDLPAASLF